MISNKNRNAFSMIELLFVIVILGIVGGIALETIRQYYENIYRTQEYTKRVSEADHILDQVSKYFESAISSSIVNLDRGVTTACYGPPQDGDANDYTIAFVAADNDSLQGISLPGWSEDTLLGANNVITATDANYTASNAIITDLYPTSSLINSAIYDAGSADVDACTRFGLNGGVLGSAGYHRITASPTANTLILNTENNATDGKRKYLLRSGYAFRVLDNGDFTMYTNFQPWLGTRYTAATKINLLAQNVAHFYADYDARDFMENANLNDRGLVWRLKVCMRGMDANLTDSDTESQMICRERRVHVRY